jgi:hypothetical protein
LKKSVGKAAVAGLSLLAVIGTFLVLRWLGAPIPFLFSQTKAAPEGVAVTISLLAFCKDNTTEVIAVKEYKLSEMQLLSPSAKDVKYLAVTATFLSGPPRDETLQSIELSYTIAVKTSAGVSLPFSATVSLSVVSNLALHQSKLIPLTPEELGLTKVGDAAQMTIDLKIQADMVTDQGRKLYVSTGQVQSQVKYEEGGWTRLDNVFSGGSQAAGGRIIAALTGSWTKPEWKAVTVVSIVNSQTGTQSYILAKPGETSVYLTGQTPTSGSTVQAIQVNPPATPTPTPPILLPTPSLPPPPTQPVSVSIPDQEQPEPPPPPAVSITDKPDVYFLEDRPDTDVFITGPSDVTFIGLYVWLRGLAWIFNSNMLLWPIRISNSLVIDGFFVISSVIVVVLVCMGLALSRKKGRKKG